VRSSLHGCRFRQAVARVVEAALRDREFGTNERESAAVIREAPRAERAFR
jgi:hypothetical protein